VTTEPTAFSMRAEIEPNADGWLTCRPVRVGTTTIIIESPTEAVVRHFDALLAAMPDGDADVVARPADIYRNPGTAPAIDVRVSLAQGATPDDTPFELWIGSRRAVHSRRLWRSEDEFLVHLNRWALDLTPELLHLHTGLVERDGVGVLLVGPSGSGKSTLTAHLVRAGWTYHSDEMVAIDPAHPFEAHSYPRPISLKRGSWPIFSDLPSVPDPDRAHGDREAVHLPPAELAPVRQVSTANIGAIVFVSYGDEPTAIRPVGPAEAIEGLTADTLDLPRAREAGMQALVDLATSTHLLRLTFDDLDAAAEQLEGVLKLTPVAHHHTVAIPPSPAHTFPTEPSAIAGGSRVQRGQHVSAWSFGDSGVIYDAEQGLVARIDRTGVEVWQRLDGTSTLAEIAGDLAPDTLAEATDGVIAYVRGLSEAHLIDVAEQDS